MHKEVVNNTKRSLELHILSVFHLLTKNSGTINTGDFEL